MQRLYHRGPSISDFAMGAMRLCFLLFCLFLVSVSSVRKLNNIDDLKNTGYGKPHPRHGLQLLFWFARNVNVDQNNRISVNFDPRSNDYGFHWFENREGILPSSWQRYYSVGNLNYRGADALPEYVRGNYGNTERHLPERNMDRLIISLNEHKVFITAHNRGSNAFNSSETYEIDPALILQIRKIVCNKDVISRTTQHNDKTEENGCLEFLTQIGYRSNNCKVKDNRRWKRSSDSQCNPYEGIRLEIKTTTQGYLKMKWDGIPADLMKENVVFLYIYQNTYSSDPNRYKIHKDYKGFYTIYTLSGDLDVHVSLNAGLQLQLTLCPLDSGKAKIWYGPEFDGANGVIPTTIKGFDARLQLYAADGKACARLYIKKTFSNWKDVLYYSWVGFYKSSQDKNNGKYTFQYAVYFKKIDNKDLYDIYQYNSSLTIAPGVQIRFFKDEGYNNVLAQTAPWEDNEKVTAVCDIPLPGLSPSWSFSESFYEPELYDGNNVIRIEGNDAGLQLITKDGKACARLYIKKTFTDWKKTFYYSWVGFYTSLQNRNDDWYTFQYAVKFEKTEDGTNNFDIYQYKSDLDIKLAVQIRFFKDNNKKLAQTEPWNNGTKGQWMCT